MAIAHLGKISTLALPLVLSGRTGSSPTTTSTSIASESPPRSTTGSWSFRPEPGAMSRSKGFSLVELAVAFAIIALLLAGALIPLSTQIDVRNGADTRRSMESIRDAITGFAQANGRLPCPADGTVAAGTANAGTEQLSGASPNTTCTNVFGVVPWATLGVPDTDAWGRRFPSPASPAFAAGCAPPPTG